MFSTSGFPDDFYTHHNTDHNINQYVSFLPGNGGGVQWNWSAIILLIIKSVFLPFKDFKSFLKDLLILLFVTPVVMPIVIVLSVTFGIALILSAVPYAIALESIIPAILMPIFGVLFIAIIPPVLAIFTVIAYAAFIPRIVISLAVWAISKCRGEDYPTPELHFPVPQTATPFQDPRDIHVTYDVDPSAVPSQPTPHAEVVDDSSADAPTVLPSVLRFTPEEILQQAAEEMLRDYARLGIVPGHGN